MTRRQRRFVDFSWIPSGHDESPTCRIRFDLRNDLVDLIDSGAVSTAPVAPLRAISAAEFAIFIGPFVPNGDAAFIEITHIGVAAQKPEQLVDDRFEVQLFRCQQRKSRAIWPQIE